MKILKRVLLGLLLLVAAIFITGLFTTKDYKVARNIEINKPKAQVFDYLRLLKNQVNWDAWAKMDPNCKRTFTGDDGQVGFISAWDGNPENVGTGQQKIVAIEEGNKIDYELKFIKPFESVSPVIISTQAVSDSITNISWTMSGHMAYPSNIMLLFMNMEKKLGADFEIGLKNLKGILEKQ
jgi:Polyketide cyclase / dehydrase and lipid transport